MEREEPKKESPDSSESESEPRESSPVKEVRESARVEKKGSPEEDREINMFNKSINLTDKEALGQSYSTIQARDQNAETSSKATGEIVLDMAMQQPNESPLKVDSVKKKATSPRFGLVRSAKKRTPAKSGGYISRQV